MPYNRVVRRVTSSADRLYIQEIFHKCLSKRASEDAKEIERSLLRIIRRHVYKLSDDPTTIQQNHNKFTKIINIIQGKLVAIRAEIDNMPLSMAQVKLNKRRNIIQKSIDSWIINKLNPNDPEWIELQESKKSKNRAKIGGSRRRGKKERELNLYTDSIDLDTGYGSC